jgi:hypothetical protein
MAVLTVPDEVLHTSDDVLLQALNRQACQDTCQIGIVAEALPIAASSCHAAQWTYNGSKGYVCALPLELGAHVLCALMGQLFVPAGAA